MCTNRSRRPLCMADFVKDKMKKTSTLTSIILLRKYYTLGFLLFFERTQRVLSEKIKIPKVHCSRWQKIDLEYHMKMYFYVLLSHDFQHRDHCTLGFIAFSGKTYVIELKSRKKPKVQSLRFLNFCFKYARSAQFFYFLHNRLKFNGPYLQKKKISDQKILPTTFCL